MITIEKLRCKADWEMVIEGVRNAMNSWDKSDTWYGSNGTAILGSNDLKLMKNLNKAGDEECKFMRTIPVSVRITAPLYWWKEMDTYKIGTVRMSCSTMHKIHAKEFELSDFSTDRMSIEEMDLLDKTIDRLNELRYNYIETKDKNTWYKMIQILPSCYMQRATLFMNYAVLKNIYRQRKNHKLDEWKVFCKAIEELPYSELFTGE